MTLLSNDWLMLVTWLKYANEAEEGGAKWKKDRPRGWWVLVCVKTAPSNESRSSMWFSCVSGNPPCWARVVNVKTPYGRAMTIYRLGQLWTTIMAHVFHHGAGPSASPRRPPIALLARVLFTVVTTKAVQLASVHWKEVYFIISLCCSWFSVKPVKPRSTRGLNSAPNLT